MFAPVNLMGSFCYLPEYFHILQKNIFSPISTVRCPFQNIEDDSKIQTTQLAKTTQKLKHWHYNVKTIYYKRHIALHTHTTITTSSCYNNARLKYEGKRKGIANRHCGEKRVERTCFWSYLPCVPRQRAFFFHRMLAG